MNRIKENEMEKIGNVYSNFDHELDNEIVIKLKETGGDSYAGHPGWDFYGKIYFKDGKFYEDIYTYGTKKETKSNEDIIKLIQETNNDYGCK